jgi:methylase of polypeptide subunit release factors
MVAEDEALLELLAELKSHDYHFITVTPATHARVLARPLQGEPSLRDIFGWNRSFDEHQIEPRLLTLLGRAGSVESAGGQLRSLVRVASLGDDLFLHSSFPTAEADAVFFGPDTYRFVRFVRAQLGGLRPPVWIVDMGAGSGAGGISACNDVSARLSLVDINPAAGRLARINARFARVPAEIAMDDRIPEQCDLVIANPPYMIDTAHRAYRDGGAMFGGEVACGWVDQALAALVTGGTMLLYSGFAVVGGKLPALDRIRLLCGDAELHVEEIDPDVFGEELERPEYRDVDRIAALGIRIAKLST